jgi:hypothetical protein
MWSDSDKLVTRISLIRVPKDGHVSGRNIVGDHNTMKVGK